MNTLSRRHFFKMAGLIATGTTLAGCLADGLHHLDPALDSWPLVTPAADWRWLNRVTFGPRPEERRRLTAIGPTAFLEEQLAPDDLPEMTLKPRLALRRLETLSLDASELFDVEKPIVMRELQQAALLRAIYSPRQLYEVMIDFWSDHFSIDQNKGDCAWLKTVDDREVIRPHALGNFHDLLAASVHSPAMLFYLDNQENHAESPNENYARELLELHTLGVESGYTQSDVQELARCLTGWTIKDHFYRGQFTFSQQQHDDWPKRVLGLTIPAGAKQAGVEQIIDLLATHPDTARFIATKLVRRFVADDPPPVLVTQAAQTFLDSGAEIKPVLRTILLSKEILAAPPPRPGLRKLKRPVEFLVSALRQLNVRAYDSPALLTVLARMGQPLFQWPTPDGFPDRAAAWQGGLMLRWHFALALVNGDLPGIRIEWDNLLDATRARTRAARLEAFATLLLGRPLPAEIAGQLLEAGFEERILLATLLGSPGFQWR